MWVFHTPQTIQQPHPLFPHHRTRFSAHSVLPSSTNHQIQTLCKKGKLRKAILLLPQEPSPTQRTYELLINCCSNISDALTVHRNLLEDGYGKDPFLATKLIDMYSQLDSIDRARQVFDESSDRSIYVWNSIFRALALAGHGEEVFDLYREMNESGVLSDRFTYTYVLKACVASESLSLLLRKGKEVHANIITFMR